jgi:hypothetical protein
MMHKYQEMEKPLLLMEIQDFLLHKEEDTIALMY